MTPPVPAFDLPSVPSAGQRSDGPPPPKQRRVKTGCLICRARKVKCDETPGTCNNCRSMQVVCRWDERQAVKTPRSPPAAAAAPSAPSPEARQPACLRCRYARSKCSKTRPACERCRANRLPCEYPASTNKRALTAAAASWVERQGSIDASATPLPSKRLYVDDPAGGPRPASHTLDDDAVFEELAPADDLSDRLISAFFLHVHVYHAYAFLHRDSTLHAARTRALSHKILLALWAIGARFAVPAVPDSRARQWADEAGRRIAMSDATTRENVVAAVLLAGVAQHAGRFAQASLWCGIANRQALSLGLHRERSRPDARDQSWVEAEGDRRLYHACYCLERQISNGSPESITCPAERIGIRLPCDGFNYRMGLVIETPEAVLEGDEGHMPPWLYNNVGPMGLYVRIVAARFMGKSYLHALTERQDSASPLPPHLLPWAPGSPFHACLAKLAAIKNSIPPRLRLTEDHIARKHDYPGLGPLVMLYVLWNMCHVELCRIVLPGYPSSFEPAMLALAPDGWVAQTRDTCLRHARAITAILDTVQRHKPRAPLTIHDHTFPRCAYSAIRTQLEIAELTGDLALPLERQRLAGDMAMMLGFMARTAEFFRPARLLLKETKRLLALHGLLADGEDIGSGGATPPYPWFIRQKRFDAERLPPPAVIDGTASGSSAFAELLPTADDSDLSTWWTGDTFGSWPEMDGTMLVGLPRWDDPVPSHTDLEPSPDSAYPQPYSGLAAAPERWQGMLAEWPVLSSDPLMPNMALDMAPLVGNAGAVPR